MDLNSPAVPEASATQRHAHAPAPPSIRPRHSRYDPSIIRCQERQAPHFQAKRHRHNKAAFKAPAHDAHKRRVRHPRRGLPGRSTDPTCPAVPAQMSPNIKTSAHTTLATEAESNLITPKSIMLKQNRIASSRQRPSPQRQDETTESQQGPPSTTEASSAQAHAQASCFDHVQPQSRRYRAEVVRASLRLGPHKHSARHGKKQTSFNPASHIAHDKRVRHPRCALRCGLAHTRPSTEPEKQATQEYETRQSSQDLTRIRFP